MFERRLYQFDLPAQLIAAQALANRDESRLLVCSPALGKVPIQHRSIRDLPDLLDANTLIVANNTKVFRARLLGVRPSTGGKVEFFLLKRVADRTWDGLMKATARIDAGFEFKVSGVSARVTNRRETSAGVVFTAVFEQDPVEQNLGEVPLPPYITAKRVEAQQEQNQTEQQQRDELSTYNTVYASVEGSVAAPTAGRHFTPKLLEKLGARGVEWCEVTLHVGLGTFKPVTSDDIREHTMHAETATVTAEVAEKINQARQAGKKILAVGTTTVRTLESFWNEQAGRVDSGTRDVNLFIHPGSGHRWRVVDQMLTNFHLPESTLLMMICDFMGGRELALQVYAEAVREHYRFYSYGDAMLILNRGVQS